MPCVLGPVLDEYAVGFNVLHGFGSATSVYDAAQSDNERPLIVLYVGDWDPSGCAMSERDLPKRLSRYGGDHITLKRIALTKDQLVGLPSFAAADKEDDKRFAWFVQNFGHRAGNWTHWTPTICAACRTGNQNADRADRMKRCERVNGGRAGVVANDPWPMGRR